MFFPQVPPCRCILATLPSQEKRIKLIFTITKEDGNIKICVSPKAVSCSHPLANVAGEQNLIQITSDQCGVRYFGDMGAGARPTASAIFDDLWNALEHVTL